MAKAASLCRQETAWNIASGIAINLWNDKWISPNLSLRQLIQGPLLRHESSLPLSHILRSSHYHLELQSFDLPSHITLLIHNTHVLTNPSNSDLPHWSHTSDGVFSTSSAYHLYVLYQHHSPLPFPHSWIWHTHTLSKIKHFLWLLVRGALPTRAFLSYRNIIPHPTCTVCAHPSEDVIHIFIACTPAIQI